MHFEQVLEGGDGIVTQMLVIDGVVLQGLDERKQVVGFGDKDAAVVEEFEDAIDDFMDVFDMGENIGRGEHAGFALRGQGGFHGGAIEEGNEGVDAAFLGELAGVGGLDA